MKSTYLSRPRTAVPAAIVGVLLIGNILSNRVVPAALYVPTNLAITTAVLCLVWRDVSTDDMGWTNWMRGARWGFAVTSAGLALYGVALVTPGLEGLFHDRRVDSSVARLFYELFVRIPLGTVLLEEVAFRGALPALFARWTSSFRAAALASALFGLWHVLPSLDLADVNPVLEGLLGSGMVGKVGGVALAVGGTFLAGMWLCFLRYRSGSILAPMIAHVASNAGGYAFAFLFGGAAISSGFRTVPPR